MVQSLKLVTFASFVGIVLLILLDWERLTQYTPWNFVLLGCTLVGLISSYVSLYLDD
jgi:hypothetical protein